MMSIASGAGQQKIGGNLQSSEHPSIQIQQNKRVYEIVFLDDDATKNLRPIRLYEGDREQAYLCTENVPRLVDVI